MLCNIFFKVQITYSLHHHQLTHLSAMQNAFYISSTNFQISLSCVTIVTSELPKLEGLPT